MPNTPRHNVPLIDETDAANADGPNAIANAFDTSAALLSELTAHTTDTSTHGVGEVVGRTETQTLSGKSLVDPNFTGDITGIDTGLAHGITDYAATTAFVKIEEVGADGGARIIGFSDSVGQDPLRLIGMFGSTNPTDSVPAVWIAGVKRSGVNVTNLAADETVLRVTNNGVIAFEVMGDGRIVFTGAIYPGVGGLVYQAGSFEGSFVAAQNITAAGQTVTVGTPAKEIAGTAAWTGLILESGSVDGQVADIWNTGSFTLEFTSQAGGSHIAGTPLINIPRDTGKRFRWSGTLWYVIQ